MRPVVIRPTAAKTLFDISGAPVSTNRACKSDLDGNIAARLGRSSRSSVGLDDIQIATAGLQPQAEGTLHMQASSPHDKEFHHWIHRRIDAGNSVENPSRNAIRSMTCGNRFTEPDRRWWNLCFTLTSTKQLNDKECACANFFWL